MYLTTRESYPGYFRLYPGYALFLRDRRTRPTCTTSSRDECLPQRIAAAGSAFFSSFFGLPAAALFRDRQTCPTRPTSPIKTEIHPEDLLRPEGNGPHPRARLLRDGRDAHLLLLLVRIHRTSHGDAAELAERPLRLLRRRDHPPHAHRPHPLLACHAESQQLHAPHAEAPAENQGASGEVQRDSDGHPGRHRPQESRAEPEDDGALPRREGQPCRRLPPHSPSDPRLHRAVLRAGFRRRTPQRTVPLVHRPLASRPRRPDASLRPALHRPGRIPSARDCHDGPHDRPAEDDAHHGRFHAAEDDDAHAHRHAVHVLQPPVRPDALLDGQSDIQHPSNEIRANRRKAG